MSSETCNESTRKVYKSREMYPDCEKKKNAKKSNRLTAHKKDSCLKLENTGEKESQNKREKKMVTTY